MVLARFDVEAHLIWAATGCRERRRVLSRDAAASTRFSPTAFMDLFNPQLMLLWRNCSNPLICILFIASFGGMHVYGPSRFHLALNANSLFEDHGDASRGKNISSRIAVDQQQIGSLTCANKTSVSQMEVMGRH